MKFNVKNISLLSWTLIVGLILCIFFLVQQNSKIRELSKFKETEIEKLKQEKETEILRQKIKIDSLEKDSNLKALNIFSANKTIDSLQKVKSKVKYIYKEKVKEIEGFSTQELENYWKDEFKN